MAKETAKDKEDTQGDVAAGTSKLARLKRAATGNWFAGLLILSLVVHVGLYLASRYGSNSQAELTTEVGLGEFRFENLGGRGSTIQRAEFSLHIEFLEGTDQFARNRVAQRKFRLQQDVEELLRESHSADFEDPKLAELKRQLQEQINESMEMRAVEQVIITDLAIQRRPAEVIELAPQPHAPTPPAAAALDEAPHPESATAAVPGSVAGGQ